MGGEGGWVGGGGVVVVVGRVGRRHLKENSSNTRPRAGFFKNLGSYPRFEKLGLPSDWPK